MRIFFTVFLIVVSFSAWGLSIPCGEPNYEMRGELSNQIEFELLESDDEYGYVRVIFPAHPDRGKIKSAGIGVFQDGSDAVLLFGAETAVELEKGMAITHFMVAKNSKTKVNVWGSYGGHCPFSISRYFEYNNQIQPAPKSGADD